MKVYRPGDSFTETNTRAIGLGNFDGIHYGHRALIDRLTEEAKKAGLPSMIYTFAVHPEKILRENSGLKLIQSEGRKLEVLEKLGVDETYLEDFTREYAELSPTQFIENILIGRFHAGVLVVGRDFTFGKMRAGTAETLEKYAKDTGAFRVFVVELVEIGGDVVSSTLIREKISRGDMKAFYLYTGRMYEIPGTVTVGRKVGRKLGFPTANIVPDSSFVIPSPGVYVTETETEDGKRYGSVTNIGTNPTFGCDSITVETNILDYDGDLYGHNIVVYFIEKIRDEIKFDSVDKLIERIHLDRNFAIKELAERNNNG